MAAVLRDLNFPFLNSLNNENGLRGGDIIELFGDPGTGKSEMLLNMMTDIILPADHKGHYLSGCDMGVVYISTNRKFDLLRLVTLLEYKIAQRMNLNISSKKFVSLCDTEIASSSSMMTSFNQKPSIDKELIMSCLENLYLFNCDTLHELTMTVFFLESFLLNTKSIGLILIDEIMIDSNTDLNEIWLNHLKDIIGNQISLITIAQPHSRLGQEWTTGSFNVIKQANHHTISSCSSTEVSYDFNICNNGIVWI